MAPKGVGAELRAAAGTLPQSHAWLQRPPAKFRRAPALPPDRQAAPAGWASLATWQGHELEAWAAATDHWHPSLLHSGGDDAAYRLWDTRQGFDVPAWQNRRAHGAGVCCVASSPHQEASVLTGSYDDRLRLWDLRMPARPVLQAEARAARGCLLLRTQLGRWSALLHGACATPRHTSVPHAISLMVLAPRAG